VIVSIVVLDTNIVSYLMKGHSLAETYRSHLEGNTLAISFMTIAELYEGAYRRNWSRKRRDGLKRLLKSYLVIPYSPSICEVWGRIRAGRKAQPISVDDAWIAASAVAYDCPLVTHNPGDFGGIEDLKILTEKV
jgi:tRNA(fMet)-specific endonuclease VapC